MDDLLVPLDEEDRELDVADLVLQGESTVLEFKSSLRWDHLQERVNKALEAAVAKSVSGFLNAEGGTLLIGVADDGQVLGLEKDLQSLGRQDPDGYEQRLLQVLENTLGLEHLPCVAVGFESVSGDLVCVVRVEQSPRPVFLTDGGQKTFYARIGNTTRPFDSQAAHEYISSHWES
jgi:predicted HTH transcriptional regulator